MLMMLPVLRNSIVVEFLNPFSQAPDDPLRSARLSRSAC